MKKYLLFTCIMLSSLFINAQNSEDEIRKSTDKFLELISHEKYTEARGMFNDKVKALISEEKLKSIWSKFNKSKGVYVEHNKIQIDGLKTKTTLKFTKMYLLMKLNYDAQGLIEYIRLLPKSTPINIPPEETDDYYEEKVTVNAGDTPLEGLLTIPKDGDNFPVVILVHGTGAHDRDETILKNKPFKDLAHELAKEGIAVLRYDKRSRIHPNKCNTIKELAVDDAVAALTLASKHPKVDSERVFVLGHSLGGYLAPMIAEEASFIKGAISMAGPSRRIEDIMPEQMEFLANFDGKVSKTERKKIEYVKKTVQEIKELPNKTDVDPDKMYLFAKASFWLSLADYSPLKTALKTPQKYLFLQGKRDYQVTMVDYKGWKRALPKSKATFKKYKKLNHLMIEGEGKANPKDYEKTGHIAAYVIGDISQWIHKN
ncbi:MAG: alpha/beta fold hydrolase [Hyphomicrobiales bacterium]